jgi:S-adenosylmethionine-diacylgycerolhomoserine-N-methlytransferase
MGDVAAAGVVMDGIYRRQRHVYDATRKYYLLGRDRLIQELAPPPGTRVLEIGCGTARNLVKAARLYADADFYGIDISAEMLATARNVVAHQGLTANVRLAQADATDFDPALLFGVPGFSRIFISYSLSMIPGWQNALGQAFAWLLPGGELHIVDFGRQERLPHWFRSGLRRWLGLFHVSPRDDLAAELTAQAAERGMIVDIERPFGGYAQRAICRRVT